MQFFLSQLLDIIYLRLSYCMPRNYVYSKMVVNIYCDRIDDNIKKKKTLRMNNGHKLSYHRS